MTQPSKALEVYDSICMLFDNLKDNVLPYQYYKSMWNSFNNPSPFMSMDDNLNLAKEYNVWH